MKSSEVSDQFPAIVSTSSPPSSPPQEKDIEFADLPSLFGTEKPSSPSSSPPLYGVSFCNSTPSIPLKVVEETEQSLSPLPCYGSSQPTTSFSSRVSYEPFSSRVSYEILKPIGAGLWNLGNTCFMNSVLQCLTHTVPILQIFASCNHPIKCRRNSEGFCVICTLLEHIDSSLLSSGRIISPNKFVSNLSNISSSFERYQQEDAHEFLQCLLDRLDTCCLEMDMQDLSSSTQEGSIVKKIFGGRLKSQLKCSNCGHCSNTFEPLIDLSLEIEEVDTLPDALCSFTKVERIDDLESKFTCDNCKKEVVLEKQFTVDQAPSVAMFHLKRFKHDGYYVEKLDKYIEYPLELDLQPYTGSNENFDEKLKYELYAIIVHIGLSYSSGHYFCYIRSSPGVWFLMDDSKVVRVSEQYVLSQEAYILFYARQGTPWFSSFFVEMQNKFTVSNIISTSPSSVLDCLEAIRTPSPGASNNTGDVEAREDKERISVPSSVEINIIKDVKTGVDTERISVPSSGVSNIISDVETKEDRERISTDKDKPSIDDCPKTPPARSQSLDIFSEEPLPDVGYEIPRNHLKGSKNQIPCRRSSSAKKELEGRKKMEEALRLTKSMPSSRGMKMRSFLVNSGSNSSTLKRKKNRAGLSYDIGGSTGITPLSNNRRRLIDFR